ncbi:hypothetical protein BCL76_11656 [Streptomyces sp. CG 926]|uniref:hypothetical protein n=1 Tax=Streptomyces sp. CG 926 TaxID=1882405 RepID=UPI000D6CF086|nr:hypothetical protein [Streptomyces sp. CG 926]PWK64194.1 hypothetical protein BCL76_11656 [Streptomyces sp. CG 926]
MKIVIIIAALTIATSSSIMYIQHLSRGDGNRFMPPIFLNRGIVPSGIDALYGLTLGASVVLLHSALPLWASLAAFWAVTVPAVELLRRRHNHRIGKIAASPGDSDSP